MAHLFPSNLPSLFPPAPPALPAGVTPAAWRLGWNATQLSAAVAASPFIAACPDAFDMVLATLFDMDGFTSITHNPTQPKGW
jgi:hypothetical protein